MSTAASFDQSCFTMHLTIRRGPKAGTTVVYCTCGWDRTYTSVSGAKRKEREHLALSRPQGGT